MNKPVDLQSMDEAQMRQMLQHLMSELKHKQTLLDKLSYEMAILKRLKFAAKTEALNADQRSLLEDALEEDLQAVDEEIEQLRSAEERSPRQQPKRLPLPAQLARQEFAHEPEVTDCCGQAMRRMGEDVAEKLDYTPGVFTVHRHVRGKWVCACCQTLKQQPVEAHIIDKGLATTGLLAQVLVAKYADHLPLYRQESIYARAGVPLARSTLAQWVGSCGVQLQPLVDALRQEVLAHSIVHADETPVQMLTAARYPRVQPRHGPSTTACGAGRRSRACWTTANCRSTTTGWRTRCDRSRSVVRTGYLPGRCGRVSVPLPS